MRALVVLASLVLLLAGCGGSAEDFEGGDPVPATDFITDTLTYSHAGATIAQADVVVHPNGTAEVAVRGAEPVVVGLSRTQRDTIATALDQAVAQPMATTSSSDGIVDALAVRVSYGDIEVETDDVSAPAALRPLLDVLFTIATQS